VKQYRFFGLSLGALSAMVSGVVFAQAAPDHASEERSSVSGTAPQAASDTEHATKSATVAPSDSHVERDLRITTLETRQSQLAERLATLEQKGSSATATPAAKEAGDGKTNKITVTPYGFLKLGVTRDSSRTAFGDLAFYVLPDSRPGGGKKELSFGARETRLGLKLSAPKTAGIVATGQFEADWLEEAATSNKYSPRLRLAFLDLAFGDGWALRAGQDWDLYVVAQPKILDAGNLGGTGHTYGRRPQVRLTKTIKFNATDSVAVKLGAGQGRSGDLDGDGQTDADATGVPSVLGGLVLSVKLLSKKPTVVSVSGAYGKEKVNLPFPTATTPSDHRKTFAATLLHGSLQLPLADTLLLQGAVFWGKNVDQYNGGILQGFNPGSESSIEAVGGWGQILWDATTNLTLGGGAAADNPVNDDVSATGRTFNSRVFGTVFVKATDAVTIGAEYGFLRTRFKTESVAENHRIQGALQYNF
jgi:hypothetical protein